MGLYGTESIKSIETVAKNPTLIEAYFTDDLMRMNSEQIKEFCESSEAQILQEKQVLKKSTLVRLSKEDDEKRRIKLTAYQLAKEANDPEWEKLKSFTAKRKSSIEKIMKKYGHKAAKIAKIAQKNYISTASKISSSTEKK